MSLQIERIGSIEKIGEYRRFQLAVNGKTCVPVWMCEPEWAEWSARGEEALWNRLAMVSVIQTRNEVALTNGDNQILAGAMDEILAKGGRNHAGA